VFIQAIVVKIEQTLL